VLGRDAGKTVVIVGHSNTVPDLVRAFGGRPVAPLAEAHYDRIYLVVRPPGRPPGPAFSGALRAAEFSDEAARRCGNLCGRGAFEATLPNGSASSSSVSSGCVLFHDSRGDGRGELILSTALSAEVKALTVAEARNVHIAAEHACVQARPQAYTCHVPSCT
jgi:hypothetical protein